MQLKTEEYTALIEGCQAGKDLAVILKQLLEKGTLLPGGSEKAKASMEKAIEATLMRCESALQRTTLTQSSPGGGSH